MFQNAMRVSISVLVLTIVVLSALGISWWQAPPPKVAEYQVGGQVILSLLITASLLGLWALWSGPKHGGARP